MRKSIAVFTFGLVLGAISSIGLGYAYMQWVVLTSRIARIEGFLSQAFSGQ